MTTAIDYVIGTRALPGERVSNEALALAVTELEALRTIEGAARLWLDKPSPRTRALLRRAVDMLPEVCGA